MVALSCHDKLICEEEAATALKVDGAFSAHTFVENKTPTAPNNTVLKFEVKFIVFLDSPPKMAPFIHAAYIPRPFRIFL